MQIRSIDRDLEKFIAGPNKPAQFRMRVSLNRIGVLSFNKNAYKQLGKPAGVYLYFSRVRDLIAVVPVQSINFQAAFPVLDKGFSGYLINAAPFLRHFGIKIDGPIRFINPEVRDGKLELKLAETISVTQVRRRKKKKIDPEVLTWLLCDNTISPR